MLAQNALDHIDWMPRLLKATFGDEFSDIEEFKMMLISYLSAIFTEFCI
jgi:hypothetical protein